MPSSARALASGPASRARPVTSVAASSSASRLGALVVAADERVALAPCRPRAARAASEWSPATTGPRRSCCARSASDSAIVTWERRPVLEADLACDAQNRRLADHVRQLGRCRERGRGLHGEHDEIGSVRRRRAFVAPVRLRFPQPSLRRGRGRASRSSRRSRPPRAARREPSRTRPVPPSDRDLHAATAPSAASASRLRASGSVISVRVTIGRTSREAVEVVRVRLVDDECVDQAAYCAATCAGDVPPARRASIRSAGPLTARPPISGLTATAGTRRAASASRIAVDREDRADRDVRVARRDEQQFRLRRAPRGPRARAAASPSKRTASTSSRWPRATNHSWNGNSPAGVSSQVRSRSSVAGKTCVSIPSAAASRPVTPRAALPTAAPACGRGAARGRGHRAGTRSRRRAAPTVSSARQVSSARPQPRSSSFSPASA